MSLFNGKLHGMTSKCFTRTITILMSVALSGLVMNRLTASAGAPTADEWPTQASAGAFTLQQAQSDPPVEQTRKNIQVLKGLPESQLFLLMNSMATSIGVNCDYCHVKNPAKNPPTDSDNWVWESDDKPKKLVGRRMIKMVLDINRTNFEGETFVTCYTCHRGSTVPRRLPPLPPHDVVRTETALPTGEQILAKYVAAVGGKNAATKFKTTVMKGTVEFDNRSEGRNAQIEVTLKAPDKYLITQTSSQSVSTLVVNGNDVWVGSGNRSRKLSGYTSEWVRRIATSHAVIKVVEQPRQMKVIGTEKIGEHEAYVVSLVVNSDVTRRFFFDTQTGLLLRELTTTRTMLAPLPEQVDFDDYRDVDGIKLPFMIRTSITATYDTATRRFTEIKHNVAVDDDVFNRTVTPHP